MFFLYLGNKPVDDISRRLSAFEDLFICHILHSLNVFIICSSLLSVNKTYDIVLNNVNYNVIRSSL